LLASVQPGVVVVFFVGLVVFFVGVVIFSVVVVF